MIRDLAVRLKEEISNPFHAGWLVRHYDGERNWLKFGGPEMKKVEIDAWEDGWDMADETPATPRWTAFARMTVLEVD
jgi:hypothetical protein